LKDANGNLLCRGVSDTPITINDVDVIFEISDATAQNGVVTQTGQTAIRDIIADNNPDLPNFYAVGSNQATPTETDTSLSSLIQTASLNRFLLQQFDTATEFQNAISIPDGSPITIDQTNNLVTLSPVSYTIEAENAFTTGPNSGSLISSVTLSNDEGVRLDQKIQFVDFEFTANQDIGVGDLGVGIFATLNNFDGTLSFSFSGNQYLTTSYNSVSESNVAEGRNFSVNTFTIDEGTTQTLTVSVIGYNSGSVDIDALYAFDDSFDIKRPGNNDFDGDTYISPELFPKSIQISLPDFETSRRSLTGIEVFQSWSDTTNNAAVTLTLGSQTKTVTNPVRNSNGDIRESLTITNPLNTARNGGIDFTLSRLDKVPATDTLPKKGNDVQEVSFHTLNADTDSITRSDIGEATVRSVFRSGVLSGNTLRESGQRAGGDLLTHSIFADVQAGNDTIIPVETIRFIPE
jgi:hypothetical protein